MSYFRTCPYCGAHLDPGEHCDCQEKETQEAQNDSTADREEENKSAGV